MGLIAIKNNSANGFAKLGRTEFPLREAWFVGCSEEISNTLYQLYEKNLFQSQVAKIIFVY